MIIAFFISSSLTLIAFLIYLNFPVTASSNLNLNESTEIKNQTNSIKISSDISQFYKNMRFNHNNISYSTNNCDKTRIEKIKYAFSIIREKTGLISFYPVQTTPDISVECSRNTTLNEEESVIVGEGGPVEIYNSQLYPSIMRGEIKIYEVSYCYNYPVLELHELMHVFGFNHVNKSDDIMYPYKDCDQRLGQEYIDFLKKLYNNKILPDLYFSHIDVKKESRYINFNMTVKNQGLTDAEPVILKVYANMQEIGSYELGKIKLASGKKIVVNNLLLPSENVKNVRFDINYPQEEFDKDNNILSVRVSA